MSDQLLNSQRQNLIVRFNEFEAKYQQPSKLQTYYDQLMQPESIDDLYQTYLQIQEKDPSFVLDSVYDDQIKSLLALKITIAIDIHGQLSQEL